MAAQRRENGERPQETVKDVAEAVRAAVRDFAVLTGKEPEAVTGVRRLDDGGWSVSLDLVELSRVPDSTSVLATYRVDIDDAGRLASYERVRRYTRGAT